MAQDSSNPGYYTRFDGHRFLDEDGDPAFVVGIVIQIFYFDGRSDTKLAARLSVLRDFLERFAPKVNAYQPLTVNRLKQADQAAILRYYAGMHSNPRTRIGVMRACSLTDDDSSDPARYHIEISAGTDQLGHIFCTIPAGYLAEPGPSALIDLVCEWSSLVRAAHGTVGLGIQVEQGNSFRFMDTVFPYLKRFPGLELGDRLNWEQEMHGRPDQRRIRATNWLNVLDSSFVNELGGRDALAAKLDPACQMIDYSGGLILRAGLRPEMGDTNHADIPHAYQLVARALAPLRFEQFSNFGVFEVPQAFDLVTQNLAWVRRFD